MKPKYTVLEYVDLGIKEGIQRQYRRLFIMTHLMIYVLWNLKIKKGIKWCQRVHHDQSEYILVADHRIKVGIK